MPKHDQIFQFRGKTPFMETMSYRTIIQEELNFRIRTNSSYSLRAFARDIGINPSQLSDVLKNKIGISSKKALIVANKLGLNQREAILFKSLVEVEMVGPLKLSKMPKSILKPILSVRILQALPWMDLRLYQNGIILRFFP